MRNIIHQIKRLAGLVVLPGEKHFSADQLVEHRKEFDSPFHRLVRAAQEKLVLHFGHNDHPNYNVVAGHSMQEFALHMLDIMRAKSQADIVVCLRGLEGSRDRAYTALIADGKSEAEADALVTDAFRQSIGEAVTLACGKVRKSSCLTDDCRAKVEADFRIQPHPPAADMPEVEPTDEDMARSSAGFNAHCIAARVARDETPPLDISEEKQHLEEALNFLGVVRARSITNRLARKAKTDGYGEAMQYFRDQTGIVGIG